MPRSMHLYTQKSARIWKVQVYLNHSKCTLLYDWVSCNQTLGCLRLYGDSRVSRAQSRINADEILLQHDWLFIFSRHNRFAETHSHLQLSYHITDRLLAAGNNSFILSPRLWQSVAVTCLIYLQVFHVNASSHDDRSIIRRLRNFASWLSRVFRYTNFLRFRWT